MSEAQASSPGDLDLEDPWHRITQTRRAGWVGYTRREGFARGGGKGGGGEANVMSGMMIRSRNGTCDKSVSCVRGFFTSLRTKNSKDGVPPPRVWVAIMCV